MRWCIAFVALFGCKGAPAPGSDPVADDSDSDVTQGDTDDTDVATDTDGDGWPAEDDCDDADPDVHPEATEGLCGSRDLDCDGVFVPGPFVVDGATSFDTLEDALLSVTTGATIDVCPGVWPTNATFYAPTDDLVTVRAVSGSSDDTVLDGGWRGRVLGLVGGAVALRDLTLRYGEPVPQDPLGPYGGALYAEDTHLSVRGCDVHDNAAAAGGGIATMEASRGQHLEIADTHLHDNKATGTMDVARGGALLAVGASSWPLLLEVTDSRIDGDYVPTFADGGANGSGLVVEGGRLQVTLEGDTFEDEDQGPLHIADATQAQIAITGCTFANNERPSEVTVNQATLDIDGTTFELGVSSRFDPASALEVDVDRLTATIAGSTFADNDGNGGAALSLEIRNTADVTLSGCAFHDNAGPGLDLGGYQKSTEVALSVTDTTFDANETTEGYGAGIDVQLTDGEADLNLERVTFSNNQAHSQGGALNLHAATSSSTFTDVVCTGNQALEGACLFVMGDAPSVAIVGGTFTSNTAGAGGVIAGSGGGTVTVSGADFGTGSLDNVPDDAAGCGAVYGAGASFTWSASTWTCY